MIVSKTSFDRSSRFGAGVQDQHASPLAIETIRQTRKFQTLRKAGKIVTSILKIQDGLIERLYRIQISFLGVFDAMARR